MESRAADLFQRAVRFLMCNAGHLMKHFRYLRYPAFALLCLTLMFMVDMAYAQDAAAAPPTGPKADSNFLFWIVRVSGWIGAVILLLSFYFVAIVVKHLIELRQVNAAPPEVVAECEKLIAERNPRQLMEVLNADGSYFSSALSAGIAELRYGIDEAREKLERKADAMTSEMERQISMLAVLGTLGPMIGLLGTLSGMIKSFSVIATGSTMDASKVADTISEALVLTFEGVLLSIPAIYFFAFFKNRISKISVETTMLADDQLRAISRIIKPKAPGEAA